MFNKLHLVAGAKVTVGSLVHVQIFTADYVLALDGLWRLKKDGRNMEISLYLIMQQYCKGYASSVTISQRSRSTIKDNFKKEIYIS